MSPRYNKNYNNKERLSYEDNYKQLPGGMPAKEGNVQTYISLKATKNLPYSSVSFTADPYEASLPNTQPYQTINKLNRYMGGNYSGSETIDGGNVKQYATSVTTKFLDYFDSMMLRANINYNYIPVLTGETVGLGITDQMRQSITENISRLDASTYRNLEFNRYAVETSMPMGSAKPVEILGPDGKTKISVYVENTDVTFAVSTYYQIMLQNILYCFNNHNSFRVKMGEMIRMEYDRHIGNLNNFFSLLKKKSFMSIPYSISMNISGEYVDTDWMQQVNTMLLAPSRRAEAITSPLLEIVGCHNMPTTFKMHLLNNDGTKILQTVFDHNDLNSEMKLTTDKTEKVYTPYMIFENLNIRLSAEDTLAWARQATYLNNVGTNRFNDIVDLFRKVDNILQTIKIAFTDFRTVLDTMERVGANKWKKGFKPYITASTDSTPLNNLIVNNIYSLYGGGPDQLRFNNTTMRWQTYSLWNIYTGIPGYDAKSGGAFLSLSLKDIDEDTIESNPEAIKYLPIGLTIPSTTGGQTPFYAVSRKGHDISFGYTTTKINDNSVLTRLAPLASQSELTIRTTTIDTSVYNLSNSEMSTLYKTITDIWGIGHFQGTSINEYTLNPDILAIYEIEVDDLTNEIISYAKTNAVFRTSTAASSFGFLGTSNFKSKGDDYYNKASDK